MEFGDIFTPDPVLEIANNEAIKLSVTDTIYYVNEKTKAVGCKLYFDVKGSRDAITVIKHFSDNNCYEVTAEARLNPGDTFDLETGKRVARAKAESMAYKRLNNLLYRISQRLLNVLSDIDNFAYKTDDVIEHNDNYLKQF
jgi:hypothetical protein